MANVLEASAEAIIWILNYFDILVFGWHGIIQFINTLIEAL